MPYVAPAARKGPRSTEGHPVPTPPNFFARMLEIDITDLVNYPDALRDIYDERLHGMIIRNVYPKDFMAQVVQRLEAQETQFPRVDFPERFKAHFLGRALDGAELPEYFRDAALFRESVQQLFAGGTPYETRLEQVFGAMAGGRKVELPMNPQGEAYTPGTIRVLPEGGSIGTHCGNEASTRPSYTHLNTVVDRHDQISFFITLQAPDAGGELEVYSLQFSHVDKRNFERGHTVVDHLLSLYEAKKYRPQAGDLLIFDGGRYFHQVLKVEGPHTRWTIGGFMMFSNDGQTLHYWS
jgi:hypothetical protein